MGYKRKTGQKYKRATRTHHTVLKVIGAGFIGVLSLLTFGIWHRKSKKG